MDRCHRIGQTRSVTVFQSVEVVKALLEVGGRELANEDQGHWSQVPLHQCAGGASGCGESAAGGRGGRELVMLPAQWSELPLYRTSAKPCAGLEAAGDAWQSAGVSLHEISILKRG